MSKDLQVKVPKHIPMAFAADALSRICDEIDDAEEIDKRLEAEFFDAALTLGEGVDRRIAFDRWSKIQLKAAQEAYRFYRGRAALITAVHSRFKEKTKAIIEADLKLKDAFRGKLGKISYCKNSGPSIVYSFGEREITPEVAEEFKVPHHYLIPKITYVIDSGRVKAELQAGKTLDWATMSHGNHVRFPKSPGEEETFAAIEADDEGADA